ncbi:MAG: lipopolysaccharide heptosyltransferase I [Zetaproteobacteria bacterium CG12_big_fil_rev_8_21_14_0_65_55_1124]|nr:MAG: lipopolysaccharide heptosyltransferase I [Zetaproteobacteria bacterium CG1_02_55_237]PIS19456.1 MAG: lipopolysaccharide heptosyltransferase I [Zetaproteobacteria bacterium CG08_land_8_20_14_0_20_55_17]PIW42287.1 MAG: lipopolysaccharide heptosyltransferase I [Zetaproteobacteria bacterium CG12_big_fil_rev_8_21_14_0_65_55_1124]PIY52524.1 MAG: lipopolysaccharide heptosyltransferase I [Zetaproteobacteria bacterium CG_4_10_14_0_8_um_filter_55_43]PIZ36898.1 MAG: lipopolysaccharide heptosyltran
MKILVVKLSAFGDIIHALPALQDLLDRPEVKEVHWLVDTRYAFVTQVFPPQVKVHQVDLRGEHPLHSAWQTIRALRQQHFDAVLDLQGLTKSAVMASLSGSPVYGMDVKHLREGASRFLLRPVPFHAEERHVVQMYRRVAAAPFGNSEKPIPYSPPQADLNIHVLQTGEALLEHWKISGKRIVWLHMGGGWATKQLPLQTWQQLAGKLTAEGIVPILGWGNEAEKIVAGRVKEGAPDALLPEHRLNMDALCGIFGWTMAVVGPDTGVVHLAAALGTPTISFWGPSASWRSAPLGEKHRHIESKPHCGPCFKRECNQFICMDMIRADDIMSAIHEISLLS